MHEVGRTSPRTPIYCWGPQGFGGSGENGYLFSGSWGALVIIFRDLGSKLIVIGDLGSPAKNDKNKISP